MYLSILYCWMRIFKLKHSHFKAKKPLEFQVYYFKSLFLVMYTDRQLVESLQKVCKLTNWSHSSSVRGGNAGTFPPPPEIKKNVVENWYYLPWVYTFGDEAEIREIFSKNKGKSIFHRDFYKNLKIFLNFSNFLHC